MVQDLFHRIAALAFHSIMTQQNYDPRMKQIGTILNGNENRMLYQLFLISSVNDMAQICTPHKNETLVKTLLV